MRAGWLVILVILGLSVVGCDGSGGGSSGGAELKLAPASALPDFAKNAPPQVQEAYRFAIANQDVLKQYPCYCGCGKAGHNNNLECYIQQTNPNGSVVFDDHAFG